VEYWTHWIHQLERETAHNDAEMGSKPAQTRPKMAETGPMLREFWFEWLSFLPQLIRWQAVVIMVGTHHKQSLSA
jgi:hypothetical protein